MVTTTNINLAYILSQNPVELRASLITYSCMLDGPSPQALASLVTTALPTITNLLINFDDMNVKEAAAEALERTAEIIPQAYFQDPLFSQIVPGLTAGIELHPKVLFY